MSQGQAKLDQLQAKRQAEGLLRNLDAASYAQQRKGASGDAVAAAMTALDEHVATHGPIDTGAEVIDVTDSAAAPGTAATAASAPTVMSSGIPEPGPSAPPVD